MTITVRLFAVLRDAAGTGTLTLDLTPGACVRDAFQEMQSRVPALDRFASVIRTAVNDEWVSSERVLHDGDELALLSPVSGG